MVEERVQKAKEELLKVKETVIKAALKTSGQGLKTVLINQFDAAAMRRQEFVEEKVQKAKHLNKQPQTNAQQTKEMLAIQLKDKVN